MDHQHNKRLRMNSNVPIKLVERTLQMFTISDSPAQNRKKGSPHECSTLFPRVIPPAKIGVHPNTPFQTVIGKNQIKIPTFPIT